MGIKAALRKRLDARYVLRTEYAQLRSRLKEAADGQLQTPVTESWISMLEEMHTLATQRDAQLQNARGEIALLRHQLDELKRLLLSEQ